MAGSTGFTIDTTKGLFFYVTTTLPISKNGIYIGSYLKPNGTQMIVQSQLYQVVGADLDYNAFMLDNGTLYWTSLVDGGYWKINTVGGFASLIQPGMTNRASIAIDRVNNKLFWPDSMFIMSSNLNGSNAALLVASTGGQSIVVDDQTILWSTYLSGTTNSAIYSASLAGTNVKVLINANQTQDTGYFIDLAVNNNMIYYSRINISNGEQLIEVASFVNNSLKIKSIVQGISSSFRLQIDAQRGKMYWNAIDETTQLGAIWRANLDGTNKEIAIDQIVANPGSSFVLSKNYIYFFQSGIVQRALLNSIECPNNCSGNGQCDYITGSCVCTSSWTGADCSLSSSAEKLGEILLLVFGGVMAIILFSCLIGWGVHQHKQNKKQFSEENQRLLNKTP